MHDCHILLPCGTGYKLRTLVRTVATSNFSCFQLISYQIQICLKCQTSGDYSILLQPLPALTGQGIGGLSGLMDEGNYRSCAVSAHPPLSMAFAFSTRGRGYFEWFRETTVCEKPLEPAKVQALTSLLLLALLMLPPRKSCYSREHFYRYCGSW